MRHPTLNLHAPKRARPGHHRADASPLNRSLLPRLLAAILLVASGCDYAELTNPEVDPRCEDDNTICKGPDVIYTGLDGAILTQENGDDIRAVFPTDAAYVAIETSLDNVRELFHIIYQLIPADSQGNAAKSNGQDRKFIQRFNIIPDLGKIAGRLFRSDSLALEVFRITHATLAGETEMTIRLSDLREIVELDELTLRCSLDGIAQVETLLALPDNLENITVARYNDTHQTDEPTSYYVRVVTQGDETTVEVGTDFDEGGSSSDFATLTLLPDGETARCDLFTIQAHFDKNLDDLLGDEQPIPIIDIEGENLPGILFEDERVGF